MEKTNFISLNEGNDVIQTDDIIHIKSYKKGQKYYIQILYANKQVIIIDYDDSFVRRESDYEILKAELHICKEY